MNGDAILVESDYLHTEVQAKTLRLLKHVGAFGIEEYSFSARIAKCLQLAGITTVDQLAQKTETDLLRIRNLGKTGIKEIKDILSYYGYSLKSEGI